MGESWRWQLRDADGQWIKMGSRVSWIRRGLLRHGLVVGSPAPGVAGVYDEQGIAHKVLARELTVEAPGTTAVPKAVLPPDADVDSTWSYDLAEALRDKIIEVAATFGWTAEAGDPISGDAYHTGGARLGPEHAVTEILLLDGKTGDEVGTIVRACSGWGEIINGGFMLKPGYQGRGFATALNTALEKDFYPQHGVSSLSMLANDDVGGYAWAKQGYDFSFWNNDEFTDFVWELKRRASDVLLYSPYSVSQTVRDQFETMLDRMMNMSFEDYRQGTADYPTPLEFAMLGYHSGDRQWFGKDLMLGMTYHARKYLTYDAEYVTDTRTGKAVIVAPNIPEFDFAMPTSSKDAPIDPSTGLPIYLYRAVSEEDWQQIITNGHIQSDGRMNLGADEGTVAADRDPGWYLPNSLGSRGRILRITVTPSDGWKKDSDGYWKTPEKIPLDRVDAITPLSLNGTRDPARVTPRHVMVDLDNQMNNAFIKAFPNWDGRGLLRDVKDQIYTMSRTVPRDGTTTEEVRDYLQRVEDYLDVLKPDEYSDETPEQIREAVEQIIYGARKTLDILDSLQPVTAAADASATIIAAIPADDDPIWGVSSEPKPHMTMIWLGKGVAPEDIDAIRAAVAGAAEEFAHYEGPQELTVTSREPLGDDAADVLMLDALRGPMERLRNYMASHEVIARVMAATDQYPTWTPHLTVGYPDVPAVGEPGPTVRFDRLALWTGEYEGDEFPLTQTVTADATSNQWQHRDQHGRWLEMSPEAKRLGAGGSLPKTPQIVGDRTDRVKVPEPLGAEAPLRMTRISAGEYVTADGEHALSLVGGTTWRILMAKIRQRLAGTIDYPSYEDARAALAALLRDGPSGLRAANQQILLARRPLMAAGDAWRWQLRDSAGQWIEMGSEVRWLAKGLYKQGIVIGSPAPNMATVRETLTNLVSNIPSNRLEVVKSAANVLERVVKARGRWEELDLMSNPALVDFAARAQKGEIRLEGWASEPSNPDINPTLGVLPDEILTMVPEIHMIPTLFKLGIIKNNEQGAAEILPMIEDPLSRLGMSYDEIQTISKAVSINLLETFTREKMWASVPEETAARISRSLDLVRKDGKICIATYPYEAASILSYGRFMSQFETDQSGGALDPTLRSEYELAMFTLHPDLDVTKRTIYGFVATSGLVGAEGVDQYGNIRFVLKPEVRSRTTMTAGDSLGTGARAVPMDGPVSEHDAWAATAKIGHEANLLALADGTYDRYSLGYPDRKMSPIEYLQRSSYFEAQIHDGVTSDDIESISILLPDMSYLSDPMDRRALLAAIERIEEYAAAAGIPVTKESADEQR